MSHDLMEYEAPSSDLTTVIFLGGEIEILCTNCGQRTLEFHEC